MKTLELTVKQSELLFEATEIFEKWYLKYYEKAPPFDLLLELNHQKLMDISDGLTEDEITDKLLSIIKTYQDMVDDLIIIKID